MTTAMLFTTVMAFAISAASANSLICQDSADFTADVVFHEACQVDTDAERTACTTAGFAVDDEECSGADADACGRIGGDWDAPTCGAVSTQTWQSLPNSSLCDPHAYLQSVRMLESTCCGGNPGAERCGAVGAGTCATDSDFVAGAMFHEACEVDTDEARTACTTAGFAVEDTKCIGADADACGRIGGDWDATTCGATSMNLASVSDEDLCDPHAYLPYVAALESTCCGGNPGAERCGTVGAGTCATDSDFVAGAMFHEACEVDTDEERTACTSAGFAADGTKCSGADADACDGIGGDWDATTCGAVSVHRASVSDEHLCNMTAHGAGQQTLMMESMCCGGNPGAERCGALPAMCGAGANFNSTAIAYQHETTTLTCAQLTIYAQVQLANVSAGTECANAEVAGILGAIGTNCCSGGNGAYNCRGEAFCAAETGACAGNDWTAVGIPEACWNAIGQSGMGNSLGGDPRCMNEPEPPSMSTVSVDCQAALRVAWQGCAGGRPNMCAAQAACDSNDPAAAGVPPACFQAVSLVLQAAIGMIDGCQNSITTNVTVACQAGVQARLAAGCTSAPSTSPPTSPPTSPRSIDDSVSNNNGDAVVTTTYEIAVTLDIRYDDLTPAARITLIAAAKPQFCNLIRAAGMSCSVDTLVVVLSRAGASSDQRLARRETGDTIATATLPAGATEDQADAITDTIVGSPMAIPYGDTVVVSTGASTTSDIDSIAGSSTQVFPALVTVAAAAILALAL